MSLKNCWLHWTEQTVTSVHIVHTYSYGILSLTVAGTCIILCNETSLHAALYNITAHMYCLLMQIMLYTYVPIVSLLNE